MPFSFLPFVGFVAGNALLLSAVCGTRCRPFSFLALWHSVPERAFSGTEYACGAQKGFLRYAMHFRKPSVLKIGFSGTEGIFGTGNALLRYETELACAKHRVFPLTPVFSIDTM